MFDMLGFLDKLVKLISVSVGDAANAFVKRRIDDLAPRKLVCVPVSVSA